MDSLRTLGRLLVPQAVRSETRRLGARLEAVVPLAQLWRWEVATLCRGRPYEVLYVGVRDQRPSTSAMLNLDPLEAAPARPRASDTTVVVTAARLPEAIRVPRRLQLTVPLGRPLDEVLRHFDAPVIRRLAVLRHTFWSRQAKDPNELEWLMDTMVEPFTRQCWGDELPPIDREQVRRIALGEGRCDVLFRDRAIVGCRLGFPRLLGDSRYWCQWLQGYSPQLLADPKRLDDLCSMNAFMDLEHAMGAAYNYYDMGSSISQPLDPDVQWKRARGGLPVAMHTHQWLSVVLPRRGAAQFLWDAPLFGSDRGHLGVWVGLPAERSDDELVERCRPLRFDGLKRLHLYTEREVSPALLDAIRAHFSACVEPPELCTHAAERA